MWSNLLFRLRLCRAKVNASSRETRNNLFYSPNAAQRRLRFASSINFLDGSSRAGSLIDNLIIDSSVFRVCGFSRQISVAGHICAAVKQLL